MGYNLHAPFERNISDDLQVAMNSPWPNQLRSDNPEIILPPENYELGNPTLPIAKYRKEVVETILNHTATVIKSGTGNGKSTQVAPYLLETGRTGRIWITQPRIIATREVGSRIAQEMFAVGYNGGKHVGFATASERNVTPENDIVVCTDGLTVMHMIADGVVKKGDHVLMDEFHERNVNMDVAKGLCDDKGVWMTVMSATLDGDKTAEHSSKARRGVEVPALDLPGQMYPVEEREAGPMADAIIGLARELRKRKQNPGILVFVPGRRETGLTMGRIFSRLPSGYTVLALNADQTPEEQALCLLDYPGGKIIIATDVAKTSLTIPGIDGVVDGQYERTGDFRLGERKLPIQPSSRATTDQRRGRSGRVGPGIYVRANLEGYPFISKDKDGKRELHEFDKPQILRSDLANHIVRLQTAGIKLEDLDLQDKPDPHEIEDAEMRLSHMGAIKPGTLELTQVGRETAAITLDYHFARMMVEARKYSPGVRIKLIAALVSCQQQNICSTETDKQQWRFLTKENRSDILVQGDLFIRSLSMSESDRHRYNYVEQRYSKARDLFDRLVDEEGLDPTNVKLATQTERQQMLACIITGGYELFVKAGSSRYRGRRGEIRNIADSTVIEGAQRLVMGYPLSISHMRSSGLHNKSVIVHATGVSLKDLQEFVPDRLQYNPSSLVTTPDGIIKQEYHVMFDGLYTKMKVHGPAETSDSLRAHIIDTIVTRAPAGREVAGLKPIYTALDELDDLQSRTQSKLGVERAKRLVVEKLRKINPANLSTLEHVERYINPADITNLIDPQTRQAIRDQAPDSIRIEMEDGVVDVPVEYQYNQAYLTLPAVYIINLQLPKGFLGGRVLHLRAYGDTTYLPHEEAIKYYSRESRSVRRGTDLPDDRTVTPESDRRPMSPSDIHPTGDRDEKSNSKPRGFRAWRHRGRD